MTVKKALVTVAVILILGLAFAQNVKAQTVSEDTKTFLDFTVLGIRVQANATTETEPGGNITVSLILIALTEVDVQSFNLSVYGFVNGTDKFLMASIGDNGFTLNNTSRQYNTTFQVPHQVWGVAYGEITLSHAAKYPYVTLTNDGLTCGFSMTNVKNVYLEALEHEVTSLNETYKQLNESFLQLQQNYTSLQGTVGELDNARRLATILGVTTVFFLLTTMYLVLRRPKEPW